MPWTSSSVSTTYTVNPEFRSKLTKVPDPIIGHSVPKFL